MPHDTPLITTIVAGLVLAFLLGAVANRLRMSPLVGYLLAGVLIGPGTPGYVADTELAPELAEIGVVLLMFGVGLRFSRRDPGLRVAVRAETEAERTHLLEVGADEVIVGRREIALAMVAEAFGDGRRATAAAS